AGVAMTEWSAHECRLSGRRQSRGAVVQGRDVRSEAWRYRSRLRLGQLASKLFEGPVVVAHGRGADHVADLGRIVVTDGEMNEATVVPHHQVANAPVVPVHQAGRDRVFA